MRANPVNRKKSCRRAEEILKGIVTGEATSSEKEELAKHLAECEQCGKSLRKTLSLANSLPSALAETAGSFSPPRSLELGRSTAEPFPLTRRYRVIGDYLILILLTLGLVCLLAPLVSSYLSFAHWQKQIKVFRAVQEVRLLTHRGTVLLNKFPETGSQALIRKLKSSHSRITGKPAPQCCKDPWGREYLFRLKEGELLIRSYGPNGIDEGGRGDDIALESTPPALGKYR